MTTLTVHGREAELVRLADLIARARDGDGGAMVIRGETGIGKSTLLDAARARGRGSGMTVLGATGVQSEAQLPFAGLHQLLQPLLDGLSALPPRQRAALEAAFGMSESESAANPFLIALATLELLGEAATRSPLLLLAEDAHWLDRPTTDALAFVARRLSDEPVALLFAVRADEPNPFDGAALPELELEPLDRQSAGELLDRSAPELSPPVRERLLAEAAGNPLALVELPGLLRSASLDGSLLPDPVPLPARLEHAFAARLAQLPDAARALLLATAANGEADLDEALRAAEGVLGRRLTTEELEPASELRLVELDGGALRFRHPLVRSAVYRAAGVSDRRATHAALAEAVEGDPDRATWHRAAASAGRDESVAGELDASAERAERRGAIATAVAALRRAAELSDGHARVRRLLRAAELAFELGRRDVALPLLELTEPLELDVLERARVAWIRQMLDPRPLDAARTRFLVDTANDAAEAGERGLALDLLWLVASRCWWSYLGDEQRRTGLAAAERLGSIRDDPRILGIVAYLAPMERGDELIAELTRAAADGNGSSDALPLLATAAFVTGAFDLAGTLLGACAMRLRAQGRLGHLPRLLVLQGTAGARPPDWTVAMPAAEEGERLAAELGQPAWISGSQTVTAYVAAIRGDEPAALTAAAASEGVALPLGAQFILTAVQWARGLAALGAGRHEDAFAELMRTHDRQDPAFHEHMRWWAIADLAEAAAHSGNLERARELTRELAGRAARTPASWIHVGLRHARALLAEEAEAERLYQDALGAEGLNRWPYQRARLLLAYGAWLRRRRRVAESRTPLRAARDAFDALGAAAWGERARQELRASGESSRSRAPEARDELTSQELQIAQMAAQGLTNREIGQQLYLSHRTIGSHLYRLFPKLGISSRAQLAGALSGRDQA